MTNEEAIELLDNLVGMVSDNQDSDYDTALKTAIKELSQEPTDAQERYDDLCEYFGEAKDILKSRKDFKAWLGRVKWHIHKAEELYEKYEYKKEPCTDAVQPKRIDYETAFKIACALLNGDFLYGHDAESIFAEIMKEDSCVCATSYEDYIITHLNELRDDKEQTEWN